MERLGFVPSLPAVVRLARHLLNLVTDHVLYCLFPHAVHLKWLSSSLRRVDIGQRAGRCLGSASPTCPQRKQRRWSRCHCLRSRSRTS